MDWVYLLNSFEGRIGRQTFWIAMVVVGIANVLVCLIAQEFGGERLSAIVDLAFTYPEFAVGAKRCHDRNLPLWLLGIFFAANAALDLLTVLGWGGTDEAPSALALTIAVPFTVLGLALLFELGFRRGTPGPNPYGPDPLAKN
jgi:uncharacterized membrane protein YhaH (DUF805 family)